MSNWSERSLAILDAIFNFLLIFAGSIGGVIQTADGIDAFKRPYVQLSLIIAFAGAWRQMRTPSVRQATQMDARIEAKSEKMAEQKVQNFIGTGTIELPK